MKVYQFVFVFVFLLGESPISWSEMASSCCDIKCPNYKINDHDAAQKLDSLLTLYAEYEQFSGSVLVSKEGEVIYKNGFGLSNRAWNIPNQIDTKYKLKYTKTKQGVLAVILAASASVDYTSFGTSQESITERLRGV